VRWRSLDDSTAAAGRWDPARTAANARRAALDPRAVYNFAAAVFHPVYGTDWSTLALK
jgi:hypothetical protein